jgi:hypothetical protein
MAASPTSLPVSATVTAKVKAVTSLKEMRDLRVAQSSEPLAMKQ